MTKLFLKNSSGKILKDSSGNCFYRTLPETYTELEYIESTGTQYIDTGFVAKENTKAVVDFTALSTNNQVIIGGGGNGVACTYIGYNSSAKFFIQMGNYISADVYLVANTRYKIISNATSGGVSINVNGTTATRGQTNAYSTNKQLLFAGINASDVLGGYASIKLYSCQLYDNDSIVRDFIPAKRNSDNVLGMYDLVNNVFYTNAGTGTFTAGPRIPSEYQEVEYIQSDGNQYIDSGFVDTPKTRVVIDVQFTSATPVQQRLFGRGYDSDTGSNVTFDAYINGAGNWARGTSNGAGNWQSTTISADTNRHMFDLDLVSNKYTISTNGTVIYNAGNSATITRTNTETFWILSRKNTTNSDHYARAKLYSCKIYNKGALVRNFIPCYRKSDNVIGLYDTVNDKFYTNSGTGTFTKGGNV